jgi:hypothetical protein
MNRENHRDKDLKNTYLWVNREEKYGEKYEELLLYKQSVPGLLTFYETEENGEKGLVYLLNHRLSFMESLVGERMSCRHMESFIKSLVRVMDTIDEYLLEPSNLVMEMDYIFGEDSRWEYVYVPGYGEDFWRQMEKLSECWLNYVDYGNEKAVLWAYTFYQKVRGEGCSASELTDILDMEKELPETVYADMIQEETAVWNTEEKSVPRSGRWKQRLTEKLRKIFSGKGDNGRGDFDDFYGSGKDLSDTCPTLEEVAELLRDEEEVKKTFVLIPAGDNDMTVIHVENFPFILGRAPGEVDIILDNPKISRIHARLEGGIQEVRVVDLSSANGSWRNGEALKPGTEYMLHTGDILKLADMEFICQWC